MDLNEIVKQKMQEKTDKIKKKEENPYKMDRVYLYRFLLNDDEIVYKIGVSKHDNMVDRLIEIVRGFYNVYRYIPMCDVRYYRKCVDAYTAEKEIHKRLDKMRYKFDEKFGGSTEFFCGEYEEIEAVFLDQIEKINKEYPEWLQ